MAEKKSPTCQSGAKKTVISKGSDPDSSEKPATKQVPTDAKKAKKPPPVPPAPEPWPEPVNGESVLDELARILKQYLSLPQGAAEAIALWVVFTYSFEAAEVSPRLALTSPTPGCGKTMALTLLASLVRCPLPASNWTPATVFRSIELWGPTLLIDEADTFLDDAEGLRGILNSGHTKGMSFVMRSFGEDHEPRRYSTWAPIAMAKIGDFTATLEERSIVIMMRKRHRDEAVERLRTQHLIEMADTNRRVARWVKENIQILLDADPEMPSALSDRAADNWRPLIAIADAAGGHWPETARKVAVELSGSTGEPSAAIEVLEKCREVLPTDGNAGIRSENLAKKLGCSAHSLARRLRPFGIRPRVFRIGKQTPRGYQRADFDDAFARYLDDGDEEEDEGD